MLETIESSVSLADVRDDFPPPPHTPSSAVRRPERTASVKAS
jgi:hypothetical protein